MSFNQADFQKNLQNIGGKVLIRAHQQYENELQFDDKLLTVFSNGGNSSETNYRNVKPRYVTVRLDRGIDRFSDVEGENIHHFWHFVQILD